MRFKLIEEILNEGKNLQKTFDQYKDRLHKAYKDITLENGTDEQVYNLMLSILSDDPTYQEGGTTTGDYGIWLLNQELKDNIIPFEAKYDMRISQLLDDFIEKKANLANKDINGYKSPEELYQILSQIQLTDRQKERKLRNNVSGAKKVGSTANFDIYIPETYEASCALGKGSGWCTADSRSRKYFDYYKDNYGGDYYIAISKDGKWKYQFHFQSQQYSGAGTNPDINNPNEEEMYEFSEITEKWPELREFFNETILKSDPKFIISDILSSHLSTDISFGVFRDDLLEAIDGRFTNLIKSWFIDNVDDIVPIRVNKALFDNQDAFKQWMNIVNNRDKNHLADSDKLQDLNLSAFTFKFFKRFQTLKFNMNKKEKMKYLLLSSAYSRMIFQCKLAELADKILADKTLSFAIQTYIKKNQFDELEHFLVDDVLEISNLNDQVKILTLFKNEIISDLSNLPIMYVAYFRDEECRFFFMENFEDDLMDYVDEKLIAGALENEDTE